MSRRLWIPIAALAALLVLGGGGAYAYFFSGLRTSPPSLALASPSPTASGTASPTSGTAGTGTWTIASGSLAGYRHAVDPRRDQGRHREPAAPCQRKLGADRGHDRDQHDRLRSQPAEHRVHDRAAGGHDRGFAEPDPVVTSGGAAHAAGHLLEAADPLLDRGMRAEKPGQGSTAERIHDVEMPERGLGGLR